MYDEEIMAISIMGVVIILPLICTLIFFIQNLCRNRRENTDEYSPV